MRTNTKTKTPKLHTHEGAPAVRVDAVAQLRRSVMSCLLWEDQFYEDGQEIGARIQSLAAKVSPSELRDIAYEARNVQHLRHVPLLLAAVMANRHKGEIVGQTVDAVVQRADELTEFLAIYAKVNGIDVTKKPNKLASKLSNQVKKGLARAFTKFDEYQLAKYNREGAVTLRDALFMVHPKTGPEGDRGLFDRLASDTLRVPDTWEVELSRGADKSETFTRLLREGKLGYMALLRNLRNMEQAGVDKVLVRDALLARKGAHRVLPFRFVAAARHAPWAEAWLDEALCEVIKGMPQLKGSTVVLVDVSGSMDAPLSGKSQMNRIDAAAALASVVNAERLRVFSFSNRTVEVPPRRGMAGVEAVKRSQPHSATMLGQALRDVCREVRDMDRLDRLIVITDEQSHDRVVMDGSGVKCYLINVASYLNGVGYGKPWVHIDGWSDNVLRFIHELENAD